MTRLDAAAGAGVAEAPGVRQRIPVKVGRATAVEADRGTLGAGVRSSRRGGGRTIRRRDGHRGRGRARPAILIRDRHARGVAAGRGVGVYGRDRARLAGRAAAGQGRPVAPIDREPPGGIVDARVTEGRVQGERAAGAGGLIGARSDDRCRVGDGGRGRHPGARGPACVRDGERYGVGAVVGIRMTRLGAAAGGAVPEAPGVRQRVSVRVRGAAAVEARGRPLRSAVGSPGRGDGSVIHGDGRVVAGAAARVAEAAPDHGNELPGIRAHVERELEYAPRHAVPRLAVGDGRGSITCETRSARPRDELTDAEVRVEYRARALRREPLVYVFVAVHHHLRAVPVQGVPQRLIGRVAHVAAARGDEAWLVPVGHRAAFAAGREVGPQPLHLSGCRRYAEFAVQGDDVPAAEIVAVITLRGVTRRGAEVAVVASRVGSQILVVARHRLGAGLVSSPGRGVAIGEVAGRPVGIGVVPHGEHGARDVVEQVRGE